jgi:hypothetical protein
MKSLLLGIFLLSTTGIALADSHVNGYTRKDGTYVEPHYRSDANSNKFDNYSTKGNTNPYTGREGSVDPYQSNQNQYSPRGYEYKDPYSNK